jgi:hypothetical protein
MNHIVLLGDSIFDNAAYVKGGPDVIRQLQAKDPVLQRLAVTALAIFNDVIIRNAIMAGVPLLDLRLICNEESDYANEIEPSVAGGEKITDAILNSITEHDFVRQRTEIIK